MPQENNETKRQDSVKILFSLYPISIGQSAIFLLEFEVDPELSYCQLRVSPPTLRLESRILHLYW